MQAQAQAQAQAQKINKLPFSKLSISDAIGLITLRLGRVEQWVIDTDHENSLKEQDTLGDSNIPTNSKIVDNSVFASIIHRLEEVEKNPQIVGRTGQASRFWEKIYNAANLG